MKKQERTVKNKITMKKLIIILSAVTLTVSAFGQADKKDNDYICIAQVLNDDEGNLKADAVSKYLGENNINVVSFGSLGLSMNVLKKDASIALNMIIKKWGINYVDISIVQTADDVARKKLENYNIKHPNSINNGQLSLEYYDKTIENMQDNADVFCIKYQYNQVVGGLVLFLSFDIFVNIKTNETKFIEMQ